MGSYTNEVIGLRGSCFQIMTADDGEEVFAEDDVIFYNYFSTNFDSFTTKFG